jgi:acyl-CoA synthetase (AMP-forming)/AMP-acid ligase II
MIVSGAENIYPAEIEAVLHAHPNVSEVAVIGVPDSRWGETVMAVVVSKPGSSLTKEELDQLCRSRLGGFKVPRQYKFVDSLPRNASGKILKRQLRQEFWPQDGRQVS